MGPPSVSLVLKLFLFSFFVLLGYSSTCFAQSLHPIAATSFLEHYNHTTISGFRVVNRRKLLTCPDPNPYLEISASPNSMSNSQYLTVTVTGVLQPDSSDWVAMISPSTANVTDCPLSEAYYLQTGDTSDLPLLCQYPVKAQYLSNDPNYLSCANTQCQDDACLIVTCIGTLTFHTVNIRTDVEFVFFTGGFDTPCILCRSSPLTFANPNMPLYGHLSSVDSSGTSMRLTWVSGDQTPQQVQYANGMSQTSVVTTFTQADMCTTSDVPSPAVDFGWHDPGFIHTAVMTGLQPSSTFSYIYGSDSMGWSNQIQFQTPPAGGSDAVYFIAYGDMGKAPLDASAEHYIQPGSISVINAVADEVNSGNVNSIFHIGDISYATGFLAEWEFFLDLINPVASKVPYMTAIGNHERDYISSGSVYVTPDSGGECGVAYETYFQMPTPAMDSPWYSIEQGSVHFTVISTEHDWSVGSGQYNWMAADMASVDRSVTPWLIFMEHRPMYTSTNADTSVDSSFVAAVEPLLLQYQVDLVLSGHVHNYERTCAVYQGQCLAMPTKDANGVDTYDNSNYNAPIQVVIGMAGFTLDNFTTDSNSWSLVRISEFGYVRVNATTNDLFLEYPENFHGMGDLWTLARQMLRIAFTSPNSYSLPTDRGRGREDVVADPPQLRTFLKIFFAQHFFAK
ncbi:putative inactive purple acid phosphatase 27 [Morella rubra]|uniref:Purple acid phosphatase n=1 Tax=Morella rubra TaxID=262757 RepID=A0A6A1VTK6_9ROSI|nr:putative inactive purple acid phosphatase 27 [Morella rubra]